MATTKTTDTADNMSDLRADLETLREDMQMLMAHMRQASSSASADAKRRLAEAGTKASENLATAKVVADRKIAERPFTSIAIAFGVGLLAGKLMDRRAGE